MKWGDAICGTTMLMVVVVMMGISPVLFDEMLICQSRHGQFHRGNKGKKEIRHDADGYAFLLPSRTMKPSPPRRRQTTGVSTEHPQ